MPLRSPTAGSGRSNNPDSCSGVGIGGSSAAFCFLQRLLHPASVSAPSAGQCWAGRALTARGFSAGSVPLPQERGGMERCPSPGKLATAQRTGKVFPNALTSRRELEVAVVCDWI